MSAGRKPISPVESVEIYVRALLVAMQPGDQLPTVRAMADACGVSTSTVSNALKRLSAENLIVTKSGWGSFVAEREENEA